MKFHFVMELRSDDKKEFPHSTLAEMCADIFTKDLSDDIYVRHALCKGLLPMHNKTQFFQACSHTFIINQEKL